MDHAYRLGDWLVRPSLDRIEQGEEVVHLKPKAMAVLDRLADAGGDVVTRDELFESTWPGALVADATLTQCVVELRHALGDTARDSRYIETIPKVGFRLVAPISEPSDSETGPQPSATDGQPARRPTVQGRIMALMAGLTVAVLAVAYLAIDPDTPAGAADPRSIAVLPFVDASSERDQAWFADGLATDLIARLATIPELRVTGQTSSFRFRESRVDVGDVAKALGVRYLLEGSVQRDGDRVRITARLIDATDGFAAWSEVFDRPYVDLIAVQDEISESVLHALSVTLRVGHMANVIGGTTNLLAYELYQKAWQGFAQSAEAHYEGIRHLERAVELDPEFARAWVALATFYNYGHMALGSTTPSDWVQRATAALETARRLEPALPIVLASTIDLAQMKHDWRAIEHAIRTADPSVLEMHPTVLFSRAVSLMMVGRCEEAQEMLERARVFDPLRPDIASQLAHAYLLNDRAEDAVRASEHAWSLESSPNPIDAMIGLESSLGAGDPALIRKWTDRVLERATGETRQLFAGASQRLDDELALRAYLRGQFRSDETPESLDYWIANWAAYAGDERLAIDALSRSPQPYNLWSPMMADVRRHPDFRQVLDGLGLVDYWREFGWPDYCRPAGEDGVVCR